MEFGFNRAHPCGAPTDGRAHGMPGELNREEAAKYLGVSKRTLDKWAEKRIGPDYRRRGRRTFYKVEDLDAWSDSFQLHQMNGVK